MAHSPSALACQAARPSCTTSPVRCTAKSMIVVVPPHAAARVPVSNVSDANVPPNGSSMCVCASTPPGITYLPVASMTASAVQPCANAGSASATTFSSSMSTSAVVSSEAVITRPPRMIVLLMPYLPASGSSWGRLVDRGHQDGEAFCRLLGGEGEQRGDAQRVAVQPALADEQPAPLARLEHG